MGKRKKCFYRDRVLYRGYKRFVLSVKRKNKKYVPTYPQHIFLPGDSIKKNKEGSTISKKLPPVFSTAINIDGVVAFFKGFKAFRHMNVNKVNLDMSAITNIDIGAIVMLLTHVTKLTDENIFVTGNYPEDEKCHQLFTESGFFEHVKEINAKKTNRNTKYNLIVKTGRTKTESVLTGKTIQAAIKYITGSEQHYTPVQSIVQEMAGNAVEHAYDDRKFWLFCVNLLNNELVFVLSDVGSGILSTLNRKYKKLLDAIALKDNVEILRRAFEKKYNSTTNEVNRNKGLPLIKHISDKKRIFDLKVITNNVYLDFDDSEKSKNLKNKYSGTLYIWKINREILMNYEQDDKNF